VRLDTHAYAGYKVPPYYDSLIAKLIVQGRDREEALTRMRIALESFIIEGVQTTMPYLARLMTHPQFAAGDIDTKFLEREGDAIKAEVARVEAAGDAGRERA
jgi:acetyl-CoA carboxylase biotin carboxylase subunit